MFTLMALICVGGVWAQPSAPAMPEAVINLNKFNGSWEARISSVMEDKSYDFDYTVKCTPIAGGNGAYWEESGVHPAFGEMHASDLFGYDRNDGKLHCYTVDNMGATHNQICEWKSPDHLSVVYNGTENGKQVIQKMDLTFKGDDLLDFTMSGTQDGKQQWSGTGTFHKIDETK